MNQERLKENVAHRRRKKKCELTLSAYPAPGPVLYIFSSKSTLRQVSDIV